MFLTDFLYLLREHGIAVSLTDALDFYRGLEKGLAPDLDSLFLFARLSFVRRVEQMDAFERAFAFHFFGVDLPRVAPGDPALFETRQFREWLKEAIRNRELPPHALWTLPPEELMRRFWETVQKQMEAHHGGSRFVGTGGNSPFGHSGNAAGGVRVHGQSGRRSALKVIGERRYVEYAAEATLQGGNLSQALASLRNLVPAGPRDQLDLPETIDRSAKNGGEIDLAFRRDLLDRIEVVLLVDNGGSSMLPYVALTRLLFGKLRDRVKRLSTYFFHNTVYGAVYRDPWRSDPLAVDELLKRPPEVRLVFLGDATMAPDELLSPHGSIDLRADDSRPSLAQLRRLALRFPRAVWLNPISRDSWREVHGSLTIARIGEVFPMEDLTLGGIKRAVERLNGARVRGR
ncbi:MAG TPA: hypothetical protein VFE33_08745 [Thermoanaerobaculia bacterium]|nr:hypothetical protein [Thermoanaerobaculia bacterium]